MSDLHACVGFRNSKKVEKHCFTVLQSTRFKKAWLGGFLALGFFQCGFYKNTQWVFWGVCLGV